MLPGSVIVNAVEHDAHTVFVQCAHERGKILFRTELGVDARIVCGIVPVIGRALKDRIQINALHAERFEIRDMLFDPPERPAEAVFSRRDKRLRAFIVPAEPVGKYLIPHGIARPGGRGVVLRRVHIRHLKRSKELF